MVDIDACTKDSVTH